MQLVFPLLTSFIGLSLLVYPRESFCKDKHTILLMLTHYSFPQMSTIVSTKGAIIRNSDNSRDDDGNARNDNSFHRRGNTK